MVFSRPLHGRQTIFEVMERVPEPPEALNR